MSLGSILSKIGSFAKGSPMLASSLLSAGGSGLSGVAKWWSGTKGSGKYARWAVEEAKRQAEKGLPDAIKQGVLAQARGSAGHLAQAMAARGVLGSAPQIYGASGIQSKAMGDIASADAQYKAAMEQQYIQLLSQLKEGTQGAGDRFKKWSKKHRFTLR